MARVFLNEKNNIRYCMEKNFWVTGTLAGIGTFCALYGGFTGRYGFLAFGIICLVVAYVCFRHGFGIVTTQVTPIEESADYVRFSEGVHYVLSLELDKRLRNVEKLRREQQETTKYFVIGLACFALGWFLISANFFYLKGELGIIFDGYVSLSYVAILLGVALIVVGVRTFWYWFMNSSIPLAMKIADALTIDTYPMKIRKENILIGVISQRIERDRKKERMELRQEREREGTNAQS